MAQLVCRAALEQALLDYAPPDRELTTRVFLSALSGDELQFAADFLGSSMLATSNRDASIWKAVGAIGVSTKDHHHKQMILVEFAAHCGFAVKFL